VYGIFDLPDDQAAAAVSIQGAMSGAIRGEVTKLLTVEEVDQALGRQDVYRAPGT
jgi:uncharacterized protein with GYD domain